MKILPCSNHSKMGHGNFRGGYLVGHAGAMSNFETLPWNHKPISSQTNTENTHRSQEHENCGKVLISFKKSKYDKKWPCQEGMGWFKICLSLNSPYLSKNWFIFFNNIQVKFEGDFQQNF